MNSTEKWRKHFNILVRGHHIPFLLFLREEMKENLSLRQESGTIYPMSCSQDNKLCKHPVFRLVQERRREVAGPIPEMDGWDNALGLPIFNHDKSLFAILSVFDPSRQQWDKPLRDSLHDLKKIIEKDIAQQETTNVPSPPTFPSSPTSPNQVNFKDFRGDELTEMCRLMDGVGISSTGFWNAKINAKRFNCSEALDAIFEKELHGVLETDEFFKMIHHDDVCMVREKWLETIQQGVPGETTFRCCIHGKIKQLFCYFFPRKNVSGKVVDILGAVQDVTRVKSLESKLKKTYAELDSAIRVTQIETVNWDVTREQWTLGKINLHDNDSRGWNGSTEEFLKLFVPDDRRVLAAQLEKIRRKKKNRLECTLRLKRPGENRLCWVSFSAKVVERDKKQNATLLLGIANDVSQLKHIEKRLKENKTRLSHFFNAANSVILLFNDNQEVTYMNQFAEQLLGCTIEDVRGKNFIDMFVPDKDENGNIVREKLKNYLVHSETPFQMINPIVSRQGEYYWISWNNVPIIDEKSKKREIFSIGNDITTFREIQTRFDLTIESIGFGVWDYNVRKNVCMVTDTWKEIHGIETELPLNSLDVFLHNIHPEDEQLFREAFEKHINRETPNIRISCRFLHPQKGLIWVRITGKVAQRNQDGVPLWINGFDEDITEKIISQVELSKNQKLLQRTLEIGRMGYYTFNYDTEEIKISPMLEEMIGWKQSVCATRNAFVSFIIQSCYPQDLEKCQEFFQGPMDAEKKIALRFIDSKTEEIHHLVFHSVPIFEETGHLHGRIGVVQDVTEQKRIEEILHERETTLTQALKAGKAGTWLLDCKTGNSTISSEVYELFNISSRENPAFEEIFAQYILPEDAAAYSKMYQRNLIEGTPLDMVCRGTDEKGQLKYLHFKGTTIRDSNGVPEKTLGIIMDVTQSKENENKIREREIKYQTLFELSNDAILLIQDWKIIECNQRTAELFGLDNRLDMIGMSFWTLSSEYQDDHTLSRTKLEEQCRLSMKEMGKPFDWLSRRINGTEFYTSISILQIPGEKKEVQLVLIRDVTEQKLTNMSLERYRAYLTVLAEMRKSFYNRSEQEIVHTFLDSVTTHFGFHKGWYGYLKENSLIPLYHHGFLPENEKFFGEFIDLEKPRINIPIITAIREKRPIMALETREDEQSPWDDLNAGEDIHSAFAIPLEISAKMEGGFTFYSNTMRIEGNIIDYLNSAIHELGQIITEKRLWENQQKALKLAKEKAEITAQAKSQFLANMSHEIRTPMTAILGYTEALTDQQVTKERLNDTTRIIRNNAEHLLNILNDILDFSKIESDTLKVEMQSVKIQYLIAEVTSLFSARAAEKNLKFTVVGKGAFPDTIFTDSLRLKQILMNLVGNAVKFTNQGEINISLSWLNEGNNTGKFRIDIIDTGVGISHEQVKNLFKPFVQVDSSSTRRFGGTGLGLAISQRLVELLDGEIQVQSILGKGSVFSVLLNQSLFDQQYHWIDSVDLAVLGSKREEFIQSMKELPLKNIRLLLAEDGKDNQRLFSFILSKAGAEVVLANNGLDAYKEAIRASDNGFPYDLILMDMQMPVMDGYTATQQLRDAGYAFPIVALTAHAMPEEKHRCLACGCDDYITKPILREALIAAISKNLKKPATTYQ